ncbi:MAG: hypothetical protein JNM52_01045 [Betaproteobacteria bacterium]|nr:hypothetical protein [Betaproteobacteria bacterium]
MEKNTKRLVLGGMALFYVCFAVYFFATCEWFFAAFHMLASLYCFAAIWYMLEAASQRHYGRVIFYSVSIHVYSLAMSPITDQLATPEGALPRVKRYFAERLDRALSHTPSEYLVMFVVCLVVGTLAGLLVRHYSYQTRSRSE